MPTPKFYPWLNTMPLIDQAVQTGRGVAGAVKGQQYDAYRITNATSGGVISGAPLYSSFPCSMRKTNSRQAIENVVFELAAFDGVCNNLNLKVGDVLVENPSYYGGTGSAYVLAQKRPMRETIFIRAESNISITRPNPAGGQAGQQPTSGMVAMDPDTQYGGVTKGSELLLTLTSGLYAFQSSGTLASVPAGLQPQNRPRALHKPDFPTQVPETRFVAYVPLLPGVQLVENDILNMSNGDRYQIIQPYSSGGVGLVGWILLVSKMAV